MQDNYDYINGKVVWCPSFRRAMNDDEYLFYAEMLSLLEDFLVDPNRGDSCRWSPDGKRSFSVNPFMGC